MESVLRLAGTLAVVLLAACGDDSTGPGSPALTLENAWPNQDGSSWTYSLVQRTWSEAPLPVYDTPEEVPPITLDQAESLLTEAATGDSIVMETANYSLQFDGMLPIVSGRLVQNLRETISFPTGTPGTETSDATFESAFLARLAQARPDLEGRIRARLPMESGGSAVLQLTAPMLLHGGAWEKSTTAIGTYNTIDSLLAWKYLGTEISVHSEFKFPLVPSLADDVFLLCRILRSTSVTTAAGRFQGALDCLYLVDYGVSTSVDEDGMPLGSWRYFEYGTVTYVPDVGPVACLQRRPEFPSAGLPDSWHRIAGDTRLDLEGISSPSSPTQQQRCLDPSRRSALLGDCR
jgi:hypothetical protein